MAASTRTSTLIPPARRETSVRAPISDIAPEMPRETLRATGDRSELSEEAVRRRAYDRYLERGQENGRAEEDWFAAEEDLRRQL